MALRFDPRGDLPPPTIQTSPNPRLRSNLLVGDTRITSNRLSSLSLTSKPRIKPCYDWIFSSGSNVHVALDKSTFKEYTPFDSYVLTLSDHRQVHVRGVGSVELKIKRAPDSKDHHTILLTDVLHIPSWLCNIFSDVFFSSGHDFEHTWTHFGVQFSKHHEGELRAWGYTESFRGLDRLVLAKRHKDSRSPMLEDKDREVFSINVTWPLSQRERWNTFLVKKQNQSHRTFRASSELGSAIFENIVEEELKVNKKHLKDGVAPRRATLSEINANIVKRVPSRRISSLKATTSQRELLAG